MQTFFKDFVAGLQETPFQIWIVLTAFILLTVFLIVQSRSHKQAPLSSKVITLGAMCIALSFVLSCFKPFQMPQGGSITPASMLPIIFFAFVAGPKAGLIAGTTYGFLQFIQEGYAAHWLSILLDYPIAFGCLGLAAFAPKIIRSLEARFLVGVSLAIFMRFAAHVLSGAIFFAEYAGDQNPWIYSMVYNGTYLGVELLLTLILGIVLIQTPIYKIMKRQLH